MDEITGQLNALEAAITVADNAETEEREDAFSVVYDELQRLEDEIERHRNHLEVISNELGTAAERMLYRLTLPEDIDEPDPMEAGDRIMDWRDWVDDEPVELTPFIEVYRSGDLDLEVDPWAA